MAQTDAQTDAKPVKLLVLQRGWVLVGRYSQSGEYVSLENAAVIRRWGTTKGLGQIAAGGPTSSTELDSCPPIKAHVLTVVMEMDCDEEKWSQHLS